MTAAPTRSELANDANAAVIAGAAACSANPSKWKGHAAFRSAHVEWGTPPDLKADLDKEFRFTLDPCVPGQVWDGREISWAGHRVFCNPPYGRTFKTAKSAAGKLRKELEEALLSEQESGEVVEAGDAKWKNGEYPLRTALEKLEVT